MHLIVIRHRDMRVWLGTVHLHTGYIVDICRDTKQQQPIQSSSAPIVHTHKAPPSLSLSTTNSRHAQRPGRQASSDPRSRVFLFLQQLHTYRSRRRRLVAYSSVVLHNRKLHNCMSERLAQLECTGELCRTNRNFFFFFFFCLFLPVLVCVCVCVCELGAAQTVSVTLVSQRRLDFFFF